MPQLTVHWRPERRLDRAPRWLSAMCMLAVAALLLSACSSSTTIDDASVDDSGDAAPAASSQTDVDESADSDGAGDDSQASEGGEEPASSEADAPAQPATTGEVAQPTGDDPTACGSDLPGSIAAFTARARELVEPAERLLETTTPITCNLDQTIKLPSDSGNNDREIALLDDGRLAVGITNGGVTEIRDPDIPGIRWVLPGEEMTVTDDGLLITHDINDGLRVYRQADLELGDDSVPERTITEGWDDSVRSLSVDANGYLVADFAFERKIAFFSLPEIELIAEFETGGFPNFGPTHLPDGRTLVRASDDEVHLVHPDRPDDVVTVPAAELELRHTAYIYDSLIAGRGDVSEIWDLSGEPTNNGPATGLAGWPVAALSDDAMVTATVSGTSSGYVEGGDGDIFLAGHNGRITDGVELADGRLATVGAGDHIRIWNIDGPGEDAPDPSLLMFRWRDVVILDDGTVLSGGQRWVPGAETLTDERSWGRNLSHIARSDAGEIVTAVITQLEYWPDDSDLRNEPERFEIDRDEFGTFDALTISGREAFAGTSMGYIFIWNLDDRGNVERFKALEGEGFGASGIRDITVLESGDVAFIGGFARDVFIWDRDGEPRLVDLDARIEFIEATPDGRLAAAFDADFPGVIVLDPDRFDISEVDDEAPDLEALGIAVVPAESFADHVDMAVAPDGRIAMSHEDGRVTVGIPGSAPGSANTLALDLGGVALHLAFDGNDRLIAVLRSGIQVWDVSLPFETAEE